MSSKIQHVAPKIPSIYLSFHLKILFYLGIDIIPIKNSFLRTLFNIYKFLFLGFLVTFSVLEILDLAFGENDVFETVFGVCYSVTHILGTAKIFLMIFLRRKLWRNLQKMQMGLFKPNLNRGGIQEFELITNAINQCNLQGYFFYAFVVIIVGVRCLSAALDGGKYQAITNLETNQTIFLHIRTVPFNTWCPDKIWCNQSPNYEILFVLQFIWTFIYGFHIGAVDATICGILMLLKAQFLILKRALDTIFQRAERQILIQDNELIRLKPTKYAEKLAKECVEHHQQLLDFCEETENSFCYLMLMQFLSSLLINCFIFFELSLSNPASVEFVSMTCYSFLMMCQVFYYCWNGNEVRLISGQLAGYVYNLDWVQASESLKKTFLLIMVRSNRQCIFTAGKFALLSLETFVSIIKGSASYFMVLRQMNETN